MRWLVLALLGAACGGVSSRDHDEASGAGRGGDNPGSGGTGAGTSGNPGSGGSNSGTGGDPGSGGSGTGTGGSNGGSAGGSGGSAGSAPALSCTHDGMEYPPGATFPAGDGCNTCTCRSGAVVGCTLIACDRCLTIGNEYAATTSAAKACDPGSDVEQCTKASTVGLACTCTTFVNPANAGAEARLREIETQYADSGCDGGIGCGVCREPVRGFCASDGICQDAYDEEAGAGGTSGGAGAAGAAG